MEIHDDANNHSLSIRDNGTVIVSSHEERSGHLLSMIGLEGLDRHTPAVQDLIRTLALPQFGPKEDVPHPYVAEGIAQFASWADALMKSRVWRTPSPDYFTSRSPQVIPPLYQ